MRIASASVLTAISTSTLSKTTEGALPPSSSGSKGRPTFLRVDQPLDLGEQTVEIDRFCLEFVAADGERLFAIASHRVRGQRDDRNVAGRGGGLQTPRRLPAVDLRQVEVHQNKVGTLGRRHRDAGGPIGGADDLVATGHVKPQGKHV